MNEEIKTLATILRHQRLVAYLLRRIARLLEDRADLHDLSKLQLDELEGFIKVNRIAREHPYGSKEYTNSLKDNQAIELHFSRNRHHPEYWAGGIEDMNFIDLVEMICDWESASRTYGNTSQEDVIAIQHNRFGLTDAQVELIRLIWSKLEL